MYGFVYITTNNVNGKKYIGQKQYDRHGKWKSYLGSGVWLKRAIQKYGVDNFSKDIIEDCETKELLDEREKYWIKYYDAVKSEKFYNIASGGEGGNTIAGYSQDELENYIKNKKKIHKITAPKGEDAPMAKLTEYQVLEIIKRLQNNDFNKDIAKDYSVSIGTIDDIRQHKTWKYLTDGIVFDDISSRKKKIKPKPVVQYSKNGDYIATYERGIIAEQQTGISHKLISAVCHGNKRIAGGYIWRFEGDEFDKYKIENSNYVKVDQYDNNGVFIRTWNSIKEAREETGIIVNSVLNGACKSAGGFYWCKHGEDFSIPDYKRKSRKL